MNQPNFPYGYNLANQWSRRIMIAWAFGEISNYTMIADHYLRDNSASGDTRFANWQKFFLDQEETKANIQAWALESVGDG